MAGALPSLLLFARTPARGRVKTRLVPPLTLDAALALYCAFLEDAARAYLAPDLWNAVVAGEPDAEDPEVSRFFPPPWRRQPQAPGDLGSRLASAFEGEFSRGAPTAVAVGSDHPALAKRLLEGAFESLARGADVAVVPAQDGGYCAIGFSRGVNLGDVFRGIPWSSAETLSATRERIRSLGLTVSILEASYDVDRPEDLGRLKLDLDSRNPLDADFPRATARVLAEIVS